MCDMDVINLACHDSCWVIDSGVSIHAISRKDYFVFYAPSDYGVTRMGNNGVAKIVGKGDVCLETPNGSQLVLKDVKHVLDIQ